jgi:hypothetical protein
MATIDADAHVIESEQTWEYIENDKIRPVLLIPSRGGLQHWLVDGRVFHRGVNVNRELPEAIRDMRDIEGRLRHMDALGIDIQVLYPSLFLRPLTAKPEVEEAICLSQLQPVAHRYLPKGRGSSPVGSGCSDDEYGKRCCRSEVCQNQWRLRHFQPRAHR